VRKESRQRGDVYWYGYRRVGEKMAKKYLGRTTDLTLTRLEQIAAALTGAEMFPPLSSEAPTQVPSDEHRPHPKVEIDSGAPIVGADATISSTRPGVQRDPLLAIKIHRPRPRSRLVSRSYLVERLQQGMEHALTLISAPAGFGKTTLLAQWLAESSTPVAWLSLEPEDNDPTRFLTYLIAALQTVDARLGTTALELLHTPQPPPPETIVALLTNDLMHSSAEDVALVLDDYHVITADSLHRALTSLVEHLPPQLHLVLATRADPPLTRLRARGQLIEVRAADLRFDTEEAGTFLQKVMGLDLPSEHIAALERRTEGWIAGLQFAALSLQGRSDVAAFLSTFSGSHRFVLDYLSDEVLSRQPAAVQSFLLHTAILERLSAPLCDVVTGQQGSQAMLEALDRANLFVAALDDKRGWYRYHHLFAEVLRSYLQKAEPALVPELHRRASSWYEQHELPAEAVQHALAVPDVELAARLIEPIALPFILQGQISTVLEWMNALPGALVHARPFLCVQHAFVLMLTNQSEVAEELLQQTEQLVEEETPTEHVRTILGGVNTIRARIASFSDDITRTVAFARQALALLPEMEVIFRSGANVAAASAYEANGDVIPATEHAIAAAEAFIRTSDNPFAIVHHGILVASRLARLHVLQGRLRQAAATYRQGVQAVQRPEMLQTLFTSLYYYFGLGDLLREWNELDAAEQHLLQGMALVNETRTVEHAVAMLGYTALASLRQARGDHAGALATLDAFTQLAHQRHFAPHWRRHIAAVRAQVASPPTIPSYPIPVSGNT